MSSQKLEFFSLVSAYEGWIESLGVPIYKDYYIEDLKTLEHGSWEERDCKTAFFGLYWGPP